MLNVLLRLYLSQLMFTIYLVAIVSVFLLDELFIDSEIANAQVVVTIRVLNYI
jgi:hypothetical protein